MPLPLIPILVAAGAGALGVGKGIKAGIDSKSAVDINNRANSIIDESKQKLELARKKCSVSLESLGSKKVFILDINIKRFIRLFEQIKNIELLDSEGLNELQKFKMDKKEFTELKELSNYAASLIGGSATGALGGALTAFGAYSAAMTFGAASTGTAIASLSGVAATNATLAFFGGGSLAVGGLGIAGGTMVLGGLVAGPALAVMGFIMGSKASKNLDNAMSNRAEAEKISEELKTAAVVCNGIRRRTCLVERLLIKLDILFLQLIDNLEDVITNEGTDYGKYTDDAKQSVAATVSMASSIKAVLDTSILDDEGNITVESEEVVKDVNDKIFDK